MAPTRHAVTRLDMGCGTAKAFGFIGADRVPAPGVDVILDLDQPLPFANDSVDLALASHSLEHVTDLLASLKEIYRVCRHGAQVCIVAPYSQQALNVANPYHKQAFNEHTPRFWTVCATALVDPAEYAHPHAAAWGLAESDRSRAEIDFRCLRMEFFYFPECRLLTREEQRVARKKHNDVCDQIIYHFIVAKQPMSEAEMHDLAEKIEYYEPPHVALRRAQEQNEQLQAEIERLRASLVSRESELGRLQTAHAARTAELEVARAQAVARAGEVEETRTALAARQEEIAELGKALGRAFDTGSRLGLKAGALAAEVEAFRARRAIRWADRLKRGADLSEWLDPAFRQLQDDSLLFTPDLRGFTLRPSTNLQTVAFLAYPLGPLRQRLSGLFLAPILTVPSLPGALGIEILVGERIVAQSQVTFDQIDERTPTRFDFPRVPPTNDEPARLRVFVRDAVHPVRVFEWQRPRRLSWREPERRAFAGFLFTTDAGAS